MRRQALAVALEHPHRDLVCKGEARTLGFAIEPFAYGTLADFGLNGARKKLAMKDWKQTKQTRTAEELEAMLLEDLKKVDGCPQSGITVTVYGIPWKSMLTFGPAAGPVRNRADLQRFCDVITERLQRLYDVV